MKKGREHPLRGLLFAQFFGAFNDNAWKLVVTFLAIHALRTRLGEGHPGFEASSQYQATLTFVVFTLPLLLFSLPAGLVADRVSKRTLILVVKGVEVVLMTAGTVALLWKPGDITLPLVVLGFMGVQSALFSPAKYGILPEILPHRRLLSGNALLQMWTFLAIVLGTASAGILLDLSGGRSWTAGLVLMLLSGAGFLAAWGVPRVAPARTSGGLFDTVAGAWRAVRSRRILWLTILGQTFFWGVVSLLGQDVLVYAKAVLRVGDTQAGALMAVFGLGVGGGSLLAGRLSANKVEYGLLPLGSTLFALFTFLMAAIAPGFAGSLVLMAFLGVASGLLAVPLEALLQWKAPDDRRGGVIALSNVFVFTGILAGSLGASALTRLGFSTRGIMAGAAVATLIGTIWAMRLLPDAFLRLMLFLLTHSLYRLKVVGRENLPEKGGALLVPNHVSFVDGLLLLASVDRRVCFVVDAWYVNHPFLRPFMKSMGAIPISASQGPRVILRALRDAGKLLEKGRLVCIFAEGQITRTGTLLPFRRGVERIIKGREAPIIPVHLDRMWGSIFSRAGGRFLTKVPERLRYPVTVSFGAPLPPHTPIHEVRQAVQELGQEAWQHRRADRKPLHHSFVRRARARPFRLAFADARGRVSRMGALAGAVALARALRPHWRGRERVGILLPPSVGGALANVAAALAGRASVNLNYTAGPACMASAARQAGLDTVVTNRTFLDKAGIVLPEGVRPLWIEDLRAEISLARRVGASLLALLAPVRLLERFCGAQRRPTLDDVVTVIFSSGSTGDPKGVQLTHFNLDSNVEAAAQVFQLDKRDRALGVLPLFHSFGTLLLWVAANHGMATVFHPNPLDGGAVGDLVERWRLTLLVATPTFLRLYMRRCDPGQFGSLRVVLAGAEKLPERLALDFEDRFGIRPLEGYGMTECSPVIAVSAQDFRAPGFFQQASRRGMVGQPLPGVAVCVVDPETLEPLPPETPGMVVVKGPNVMKGYLGRDDLTAQTIRKGWLLTGDIGLLDADGFLKITDRISRFSKIGGEMVPHGAVEEALQEAAGLPDRIFAVTSVSDERKGERLAVLHTLDEGEIPALLEKLAASDLPNLFLPRANQFVRVEELPVLGSGKLDLRAVRRIAEEALG